MRWRTVAYSLLLGGVTSMLIGTAETCLPDSDVKGVVIDTVALPGAILAALCFPEGPHTGHGAPAWGVAVLVLNLAVYSGVWLAILLLFRRRRTRKVSPPGGGSL